MKRLLVAYATKHESTAEIAQLIGRVLRERTGAQVEVTVAASNPDPTLYDAIVLGSAVYMGKWQPEAAHYLREHADVLSTRPLWLFSSGPIGDSGPAAGQPGWEMPEDLLATARSLHPRDIAVFSGKLDATKLNWLERGVMSVLHAPSGDFRKWDDIGQWAADIATEVMSIIPNLSTE